MAIDNTPPRLRLIGTIAIIVIITLVSLDFVFKSYFAYMTDEAQREKLAPRTALAEQVAFEHASLTGAKIPLERAMTQLAAGSRPELIEPTPSEDLGPLTGWAKLPKQAPLGVSYVGGARPGAPSVVGGADAGGPTAADGGITSPGAGRVAGPKDAGAAVPAPVGSPKDAGVRAPQH